MEGLFSESEAKRKYENDHLFYSLVNAMVAMTRDDLMTFDDIQMAVRKAIQIREEQKKELKRRGNGKGTDN